MSRLSDAQIKYPLINWEVAKIIDPSSNHKYLDWIGDNITKLSIAETGYFSIKNVLVSFEKKKAKLVEKDITKYTYSSLKEILEKTEASRKETKIAGAINVDEIDGIKIILLEGIDAAKQYCAGTKWCISNPTTFLQYCADQNLFVLIKNGKKLCVPVYNDYISSKDVQYIYDAKDNEIYLYEGEGILEFLDIKNPLNAAIQKCIDYSKTYSNFWMKNIPTYSNKKKKVADPYKDFQWKEYLIKAKSLGLSAEKDIYKTIVEKGEFAGKSFVQFVIKNSKDYPQYIKLIKSCKQYPFTYRATKLDSYGYSSYESKLYSAYYNELVMPAVPKVDAKKSILAKIKKRGGLEKLLENESTRKQIEKLLKEAK